MPLNQQTKTEVIKQACNDSASGRFTEYKGDTLTDIVFSPVTAITGEPTTKEHAAEKQDLYNRVRSGGC